jgi:hypothetical protein
MSAWTVIAHTELASAQAEITFMSVGDIPSTYTDLYLVVSARSTASGGTKKLQIKFNGSDANFSTRVLQGTGSSVSSYTETNYLGEQTIPANTADTFASFSVYIPNYRSSTNKSFSSDAVNENNATTAYPTIIAGLWSQTAAITSITLVGQDPNLAQYTSATLYGITKGSSGGVTVS